LAFGIFTILKSWWLVSRFALHGDGGTHLRLSAYTIFSFFENIENARTIMTKWGDFVIPYQLLLRPLDLPS
jgi:hypothetical protein